MTERKPQRVTTDKHPPYCRAIRWILGRKVVHRTNPYLNNLTEHQFDQTADGRVLKLLNIVDEHTREALAIVAARSITADATASMLEGIVARRGTAPAYIRCD